MLLRTNISYFDCTQSIQLLLNSAAKSFEDNYQSLQQPYMREKSLFSRVCIIKTNPIDQEKLQSFPWELKLYFPCFINKRGKKLLIITSPLDMKLLDAKVRFMNKAIVNEIEFELEQLIKGDKTDWIQIGMVLSKVRETRYWNGKNSSFSKWLASLGKEINLGKATLWRYITAQDKYARLKHEALEYGYTFSSIEQLECSISPEGIELFDKLSRVLEEKETYEMMNSFIEGKITRKELREKWNVFKPALEGKTARGLLGSDAPRLDKSNKQQKHFIEESIILDALRLKSSEWLCEGKSDKKTGKGIYPNPYFFKFFQSVRVANHQNRQHYALDAVLSLKEKVNSPLQIHGVEIAGVNFKGTNKVEVYRKYCNAFWIAIPEGLEEGVKEHIPQGVGLVTLNNKEIKVLIKAELNNSPELLVETLKELLTRWKTA